MNTIENLNQFGYPGGMFISLAESLYGVLYGEKKSPSLPIVVESDEEESEVEEESEPAESSAELETKVLALREQGMSFVSIARELGLEIRDVISIVNSNN